MPARGATVSTGAAAGRRGRTPEIEADDLARPWEDQGRSRDRFLLGGDVPAPGYAGSLRSTAANEANANRVTRWYPVPQGDTLPQGDTRSTDTVNRVNLR